MRGYKNGPEPHQVVILFCNTGIDGTKLLPKFLDFVLPVHKNACLEPDHLKTTSQLPAVARFPDAAWAERFARACLERTGKPELVLLNHMLLLPWADAQPLIKTR